jgi:hypothetical protein
MTSRINRMILSGPEDVELTAIGVFFPGFRSEFL